METREKEINGKTYSILTPSVRVSMEYVNGITFLITPILPSLTKNTEEGGWINFSNALNQADPSKLDKLLMGASIASKLSHGGVVIADKNGLEFEKYFGIPQNKRDLYPVLCWCLWEVVKDFFPDWTAFIQNIKEQALEKIIPLSKTKNKSKSQRVGR
jgi:hypothetical protein